MRLNQPERCFTGSSLLDRADRIVEDSEAQLVILSPLDENGQKMVFCVDASKRIRKCDFLIPVNQPSFTMYSNKRRRL